MNESTSMVSGAQSVLGEAAQRLTFSAEQAFAALGIGRTLGYRKIREGAIPAVRIGARWVVPKAALERMLTEQCGVGWSL
jgi:excisionase family DNA binding protein